MWKAGDCAWLVSKVGSGRRGDVGANAAVGVGVVSGKEVGVGVGAVRAVEVDVGVGSEVVHAIAKTSTSIEKKATIATDRFSYICMRLSSVHTH